MLDQLLVAPRSWHTVSESTDKPVSTYSSSSGHNLLYIYRMGRRAIGALEVVADYESPSGELVMRIAGVYVRPEFRRQGIATTMLSAARAHHEVVHSAERTDDGDAWMAALENDE